MTTATDTLADFTARTQELTSSAVQSWADAVQAVTGTVAGATPAVPDLGGYVDRWFDVAQQILDQQRRFAHELVAVGTQAAGAFTEQATKATETYTARVVDATANSTRTATSAN